MKARKGRLKDKTDSPRVGNWLRRYVVKRTCRAWKRCYRDSTRLMREGDEMQNQAKNEIKTQNQWSRQAVVGLLETRKDDQ